MTKKQFIHALEGLDDQAQIHFFCESTEIGAVYIDNIRFEDKVTGDKFENEITIVLEF